MALKVLYSLLYSVGLILAWGLLLLDANKPGHLGILICLCFTFYSPYFAHNLINSETRYLKYLPFLFPLIYACLAIIADGLSFGLFLNPIIVAFIILTLGFRLKSIRKQVPFQFFTVMFIYIYSFSLYNYWFDYTNSKDIDSFDFTEPYSSMQPDSLALFSFPINRPVNIGDFKFMGPDYSVAALDAKDKPIIIETWNERCPPCLKAIKDLQDYFNENENSFTHYYVYQPRSINYSTDKVMNFNLINNRSNSLIDVDNSLYDSLSLSGYPYFLLFDSSGDLTHINLGYNASIKKDFILKLNALIRELSKRDIN